MRLSREEIRRTWAEDQRKRRRRLLRALGVTAGVFLLSLCVRYNAYYYEDKFVPLAYLKSYLLALRLLAARLTKSALFYDQSAAIEAVGGSILYLGALARLKITLMALVSGAALSIAGAIFQTAYRNPMASPNILGATAGVKLGNVLVILLYSAAAVEKVYLRYQFCYGFTAVCVLAILLLGRLAGSRRENFSVMEMVMVGSIVSQALNVVTMYLMYQLEDEDLLLYQQLSLGAYLQTDRVSMTIFFLIMAIAILPVLLMRYRMNIIGLDKMETTTIGLNPRPLRLVGQFCGVLMVTCAMIHCGEVGMLSMVIPYIVRQSVGADFRQVCVYSALGGGVLLMVCRLLTTFIVIENEPVPVSFLVNLILVPIFMVILARQRGNLT